MNESYKLVMAVKEDEELEEGRGQWWSGVWSAMRMVWCTIEYSSFLAFYIFLRSARDGHVS